MKHAAQRVASIMNETQIRRNSVIETLRLMAMYAIVLHHYCMHGGVSSTPGMSSSTLTIAAGASFGRWGVDVFVLIAGYFLTAQFTMAQMVRHAVKFCVQVWTISILCLLFAMIFSGSPVGARDILASCLPLGYDVWWFATAYFVLLVLSPFINILLFSLSKSQHAELVAIMLLFWSALSTILPASNFAYSKLSLFVMLYLIASYIRRYVEAKDPGKWAKACACLLLLLPVSSMSIQALSGRFAVLAGKQLHFASEQSPLTIAAAVATLMVALSLKPRYSAAVNLISTGSFGIYLFSDHPLIEPILWGNLIHTRTQFSSAALPALMLASSFAVFLAALAVEMLRQVMIQRPLMLLIESTLYKSNLMNRCASGALQLLQRLQDLLAGETR